MQIDVFFLYKKDLLLIVVFFKPILKTVEVTIARIFDVF